MCHQSNVIQPGFKNVVLKIRAKFLIRFLSLECQICNPLFSFLFPHKKSTFHIKLNMYVFAMRIYLSFRFAIYVSLLRLYTCVNSVFTIVFNIACPSYPIFSIRHFAIDKCTQQAFYYAMTPLLLE